MDVTEMHERAQRAFSEVLLHVSNDDLSKKTPCNEWSVTDLIDHVVQGNQTTAARFGVAECAIIDGDRNAIHAAVAEQANAALREPNWREQLIELPFATVPAPVFVSIRSGDVYTHAWDLARAIGGDSDLDRELGEAIFAATAPVLTPALRGEGRPFAQQQPCDPTRPVADRLAAFLGRQV